MNGYGRYKEWLQNLTYEALEKEVEKNLANWGAARGERSRTAWFKMLQASKEELKGR
jgi:hypothetical protein